MGNNLGGYLLQNTQLSTDRLGTLLLELENNAKTYIEAGENLIQLQEVLQSMGVVVHISETGTVMYDLVFDAVDASARS